MLSSGPSHNRECTQFCAPGFCGHHSGGYSTGSWSRHPSILNSEPLGSSLCFAFIIIRKDYYYQERHNQSLIFLPGKEVFRAGGKVGLMIGVCNPAGVVLQRPKSSQALTREIIFPWVFLQT